MLKDISAYIQSSSDKHRDGYSFNHLEKIGSFLLKPAVWIAPYLDKVIFEEPSYSLKSISLIVASVVIFPLTLIGLIFKRVGERHSEDGALRREYTKTVFLYDKYALGTRVLDKAIADQIEYFFNNFSIRDIDFLVNKLRENNELYQKLLAAIILLHPGRMTPHPLRRLEFHLKSEQAHSELDHLLNRMEDTTLFDMNHFVSKNLPYFVSQIHDLNRAKKLQENLFVLSQKISEKFGKEGDSLAYRVFVYAKGPYNTEKASLEFIEDVLSEIFSHLTKKEFPGRDTTDVRRDLEAISLVCKDWEKAARKIKGPWIDQHNLSGVEFSSEPTRAIAAINRYNCNHGNLADFITLSNEHLNHLAQVRPNLTHLSIQSERITDFSLHLFQELQSLTIYGCSNYPEAKLAAALPSLKKLKELKLINCKRFTGDHLKNVTSLKQLKVFHFKIDEWNSLIDLRLSVENLQKILSHFSELEDLDLCDRLVEGEFLNQLAESLDKNRLKAFAFCNRPPFMQPYGNNVTNQQVYRFILNFPNLEKLRLKFMSIADGNEFSNVLAAMPQLRILQLDRSSINGINPTFDASRLIHLKELIIPVGIPVNEELKMFTNLKLLYMGTPSELNLSDLASMKKLRILRITLTSTFKDQWMSCFQKMKFLKHLILDVRSKQDFPPLSSLVGLKSLEISCEANPDKFLKTLPSLIRLQSLTVNSRYATQDLFDRTALALPHVGDLTFVGARNEANKVMKFERRKHHIPSD